MKSPETPIPAAEAAPQGELRLADLPPGASAEVVSVSLESPMGRRLLDLGFTPKTPVRVLRRAPLGDPSVYELRGMRLCLRRDDAAWVLVRRR